MRAARTAAGLPHGAEWNSHVEPATRPDPARTLSFKPPTGAGPVRLPRVGEPAGHVSLQPCGGTGVSRAGGTGPVPIGRIENKGRHSRRVNRRLAEHGAGAPQSRSAGPVTRLLQTRRSRKPGRRGSERALSPRAFGPDGPIRCRTSYSLYSRKSYRGGSRASISARGIRLLTTNTPFSTWLM